MLFVLTFVFIVLSMIVLFINIEQNKGIVPFIFLFSTLFYLFSNYDFIFSNDNNALRTKREKKNIVMNILTIFGFIISVLFFVISYFVFWA